MDVVTQMLIVVNLRRDGNENGNESNGEGWLGFSLAICILLRKVRAGVARSRHVISRHSILTLTISIPMAKDGAWHSVIFSYGLRWDLHLWDDSWDKSIKDGRSRSSVNVPIGGKGVSGAICFILFPLAHWTTVLYFLTTKSLALRTWDSTANLQSGAWEEERGDEITACWRLDRVLWCPRKPS